MSLDVAEAATLPQRGKKEGSKRDAATPAWLQPSCFWAGPAGSAGFHCGRAPCLSHPGRESTYTAQNLPGVYECGMGHVGTLCYTGTARPVPLLTRRKVSTFPGWGCAFPAVSCWLSAWAKAAPAQDLVFLQSQTSLWSCRCCSGQGIQRGEGRSIFSGTERAPQGTWLSCVLHSSCCG